MYCREIISSFIRNLGYNPRHLKMVSIAQRIRMYLLSGLQIYRYCRVGVKRSRASCRQEASMVQTEPSCGMKPQRIQKRYIEYLERKLRRQERRIKGLLEEIILLRQSCKKKRVYKQH